ncbi:DUF3895 domain-containing protein [Bacillus sp. AGSP2]|uniref:DUF3895 domain-containing protein n=1 Tax=Bacillus sp. AGSP2 TaxID=3015212 RepID=UPI00235F9145|nr:DUF3895 domain-containing protein [Bacillus sp. AGSP2]
MVKDISFLNEEQKKFLMDYVKTKKVDAFNKVQKVAAIGYEGLENASSEDMQLLIDEWVLIDYIDNGFVNNNTPCECGRPLRYQYIVKNNKSGEIKRLGVNHFEKHISLKKHVVKQIKKEFDLIDKEITEILDKTKAKWSIENEIIKKQLDMGLALSARQINYLLKEVNQKILSDNKTVNLPTHEVSNIDVYNYEEKKITSTDFSLTNIQKERIRELYNRGVKNPETICEFLIKNKIAPSHRYSTGKPKIFPSVCIFLENINGS